MFVFELGASLDRLDASGANKNDKPVKIEFVCAVEVVRGPILS
jgi:hypothetical protein